MTIDLDNGQQIVQDDNIEIFGLDKFTPDVKAQLIEDLAEGIMNRILEDERIGAITSSEKKETNRRGEGDRKSNRIEEIIQKKLKNTNQYIYLKDLVPKNNKTLNKVLNQYDNAKKYLQIVRLLYEELSVEHQDFPVTKDKDYWDDADQIVEILMRLESFMLTLILKPTPVFIHYASTGNKLRNESSLALEKRMTNLGREFLFIWSQEKFIRRLDHGCLTSNIKILFDFFTNLRLNPRSMAGFTIELDVTFDSLTELNHHLMKLKAFVESGRLNKNLASQQIHRTRDGDEEPKRLFVRPDRVEFNGLWSTNTTKWKEAVEYFRNRYRDQGKSILLYRAEIRLSSSTERVIAKQFQNFFGAFNKKANTPKGLIGYSDFLYFWKEDFSKKELVLDLVSIFEADTLITKRELESGINYFDRNICEELGDYLRESLRNQKELFKDNEVVLRFSPIPVLLNPSHEFAPEFLIEVGDQKKWNIFENKIIPYFVFMETFDLPYSDDIAKRFTRAQKRIG